MTEREGPTGNWIGDEHAPLLLEVWQHRRGERVAIEDLDVLAGKNSTPAGPRVDPDQKLRVLLTHRLATRSNIAVDLLATASHFESLQALRDTLKLHTNARLTTSDSPV